MKIISGDYKGSELKVPKQGTRPTTSKLKEAIFSSLQSRLDFKGKVVLDLFAGSGALGLEALSRGAEELFLVDSSKYAAKCLNENASPFKNGGKRVRVFRMCAEAFLKSCTQEFDLIFLDPPYIMNLETFSDIVSSSMRHLKYEGYLIAERQGGGGFPKDLESVKKLRSGSGVCEFLRKG